MCHSFQSSFLPGVVVVQLAEAVFLVLVVFIFFLIIVVIVIVFDDVEFDGVRGQ